MRAAVICLAVVAACVSPPPAPPPAPVPIEASPHADAATAKPFDAGRAALRRCLDQATCGDGCADRCRAHDHEECFTIAEAADPSCRQLIGETACGLGHGKSCLDVGQILSSIDPARARQPLERACHANLGEACLSLGVVELRDPERRVHAVSRFERACELRVVQGCVEAGRAYRHGNGVDRDLDRGLALMDQACLLGEGAGCYELAKVLLQDLSTKPKGIALLEETCLHKPKADGQACMHLFTLMPTLRGKGLQADEVLMKGCDKGQVTACEAAAERLYRAKDWPRVIEASTKLVEQRRPHWVVWFRRAMAQLNLGHPKEAIPDLEQLCTLRRDWVHCHLWLWAARERSGATADPALDARRKTVDGATWPAPVMDHFLGRMSAVQLLAKAKNSDARIQKEQLCEAHYYIGIRHLVRGDTAGARRSFERTIQFQITNFIEHMRALAELDRLAAAKP